MIEKSLVTRGSIGDLLLILGLLRSSSETSNSRTIRIAWPCCTAHLFMGCLSWPSLRNINEPHCLIEYATNTRASAYEFHAPGVNEPRYLVQHCVRTARAPKKISMCDPGGAGKFFVSWQLANFISIIGISSRITTAKDCDTPLINSPFDRKRQSKRKKWLSDIGVRFFKYLHPFGVARHDRMKLTDIFVQRHPTQNSIRIQANHNIKKLFQHHLPMGRFKTIWIVRGLVHFIITVGFGLRQLEGEVPPLRWKIRIFRLGVRYLTLTSVWKRYDLA